MSEFVSPIDELRRALALLDWCRKVNNKEGDAWEWIESAARDVVDLYKPEDVDG